jgi:two-component system, chemotaxis family, response regulator Rcp1
VTSVTRTEALELLVLGNAGTGLTSNGALPARLAATVTIGGNPSNALTRLRKQGHNAAAKRLILLDLDGEQGWGLLREIKADPQLRRIPVIVLGAANSSAERARAYDLHANCYLRRPEDKERLGALLESIEDFWFMRVRLPVG